MKETHGVIIISDMRTKNYDQIMYGSCGRVDNAWVERGMDETSDIDVDEPPKKSKIYPFCLASFHYHLHLHAVCHHQYPFQVT